MKTKGYGSRIPGQFRHLVFLRIHTTMHPQFKKRGWTYFEAVAKELNVTPVAVYFWYRGTTLPSLYNLVNFADAMDVSVDHLLGRKGYAEVKKSGHLKVVG